jgi:hypothetical protein
MHTEAIFPQLRASVSDSTAQAIHRSALATERSRSTVLLANFIPCVAPGK